MLRTQLLRSHVQKLLRHRAENLLVSIRQGFLATRFICNGLDCTLHRDDNRPPHWSSPCSSRKGEVKLCSSQGLSSSHQGLLVALQQDYIFDTSILQSQGCRTSAPGGWRPIPRQHASSERHGYHRPPAASRDAFASEDSRKQEHVEARPGTGRMSRGLEPPRHTGHPRRPPPVRAGHESFRPASTQQHPRAHPANSTQSWGDQQYHGMGLPHSMQSWEDREWNAGDQRQLERRLDRPGREPPSQQQQRHNQHHHQQKGSPGKPAWGFASPAAASSPAAALGSPQQATGGCAPSASAPAPVSAAAAAAASAAAAPETSCAGRWPWASPTGAAGAQECGGRTL